MNPPSRFCFPRLPALLAVLAFLVSILFFDHSAQAVSLKQADSPPVGDEPLHFTQVVAGEEHACGLTKSGGVFCWGSNGNDQLGDGSGLDSSTAVPVAGLDSGVVQLAAGGFETCALMEDGSTQCWPQDWESTAPYTPKGLEGDVTALAGGRWHFCAIVGEQLLCWGSNGDGQLGDGTTDERTDPTPVQGLAGAPVAVDAGDDHTCALLSDGAVQCWGANSFGQLGDRGTDSSAVPTAVAGLAGPAVSVAAGMMHSCAQLEDETVQCWGYNAGLTADRSTWTLAEPTTIKELSGANSGLAAGGHTTCSVIDGKVRCVAASNTYGQLGDAAEGDDTRSTEPVDLADAATSVSLGLDFACATLANGEAQCWGYNQRGQLGAGSLVMRDVPMTVPGVVSPTMMATGGLYVRGFTCTEANDGLFCWGDNAAHQLSTDPWYQSGSPLPGHNLPAAVVQMSAGLQRTCVLLQTGSIQCWGPNFFGDLGNGSDESSFDPTQVVGLTRGITTLVGGNRHLCALSDQGRVSCWGDNREGHLGTGDGESANSPVTPEGLESGVTALHGSNAGTCAQMEDGQFLCWGPNNGGALGVGDDKVKTTPTPLTLLDETPVMLAIGGSHTCALLEGGAAECWGDNFAGQLGVAGTNVLTTTTALVKGLPGPITSIRAGERNTCAILEDSRLWCWGWNHSGELGAGSAVLTSTVPLPVVGLGADVADVVIGAVHSCAILTNGELRCWGQDGDGQLGIGTDAGIATPQTVTGSAVQELALDATQGAPGSRFTLTGFNLPADVPLT